MPASPNIGFFPTNWIVLPEKTPAVRLRLVAQPPVVATLKVVIDFAPTVPDNQASDWQRIASELIDNSTSTSDDDGADLVVRPGTDYRIRFDGAAVLGMLGFTDITLGMELVRPEGANSILIDNFGGQQQVKGQSAFCIGRIFIRCPAAA